VVQPSVYKSPSGAVGGNNARGKSSAVVSFPGRAQKSGDGKDHNPDGHSQDSEDDDEYTSSDDGDSSDRSGKPRLGRAPITYKGIMLKRKRDRDMRKATARLE
jgi:hypothetical protein